MNRALAVANTSTPNRHTYQQKQNQNQIQQKYLHIAQFNGAKTKNQTYTIRIEHRPPKFGRYWRIASCRWVRVVINGGRYGHNVKLSSVPDVY